jgi:hypothetical protein
LSVISLYSKAHILRFLNLFIRIWLCGTLRKRTLWFPNMSQRSFSQTWMFLWPAPVMISPLCKNWQKLFFHERLTRCPLDRWFNPNRKPLRRSCIIHQWFR